MIDFNTIKQMQLRARVEFMKTKNTEKEIEALLLSSFIADLQRQFSVKTESIPSESIIQLAKQFIKNLNETEKAAGSTEKTKVERRVIMSILPPQKTIEEMKTIVESTVSELNASTIKDFGKVLNSIKSKYDGTYDVEQVVALIKSKLN
jgi:uncharacterized protein YqeY